MSNHLLESSTGDKLVTESGHYRTPANSRDPIHPPISHPTAPPSVATSPVSNATNKSAAKADVPLRDILEQYTNNEDILRLVLTAKIEEDKRYAAQANAQAEQAKLESRRVELEIVQSQQLQQQQQQQQNHSQGNHAISTRMTRSITDYHQMLPTHPGRPTPPDVKRSHSIEYGSNSLPQMNNYTPSTQSSSTHRSRGSPENDNSFFGRASNGSATTSNTTSSSKLSSYAPPSFTDCLAFSPADITHMPPLPVSSSGPSDSPALSRSRSAYTTGRQTEGNNSDGGNGSDSALTPTTLKRRQHEEAMRTVRERVLSKRRALSYHNDSNLRGSTTRTSHDTIITRNPRDISPPNHHHHHHHHQRHHPQQQQQRQQQQQQHSSSSRSHSYITTVIPTDDRSAVTLPPLTVTHPAAHRAR